MSTRKWSDPGFELVALVIFSAIAFAAFWLSGCITAEQRDKIAGMIPVATPTLAPTATATPEPTATPLQTTGDKRADLCARFGARYVDDHVIFDGLSVDTRNRLFVAWCSEKLGVMPVLLNGNEIFMRCK
jgi:hypothetical protein